MAPSAHSIPSLLPWQPLTRTAAHYRASWSLTVANFDGRPALTLYLHQTLGESYVWDMVYSEGGYPRISGKYFWRELLACEQELLARVAQFFHAAPPRPYLPASLPPQGTTIAPAGGEG